MGVVITGVPDVDRKLKSLPEKLQVALAKEALVEATNLVYTEYEERVPVLSGAMRGAVVIRAKKKRIRGEIGREVRVDPKRLAKHHKNEATKLIRSQHKAEIAAAAANINDDASRSRREKTSAKRLLRDFGRKHLKEKLEGIRAQKYFYPAMVELGDEKRPGQRPLRGALYDNATRIRAIFIKTLRLFVARAGGR